MSPAGGFQVGDGYEYARVKKGKAKVGTDRTVLYSKSTLRLKNPSS